VWWDQASMESRGRTFLTEIRCAIADASRLVLVCSPAALESEYVRAEWEHARAEVVAITPVVRVAAADGFAASIPRELAMLHAVNATQEAGFDAAVVELVRLLEQPAARSSLYRVPQPSVALAREEEDELRGLVLAPSMSPVTLPAERRVLCVVGMGGVGKSTMVATCARSYEARFAVESVHWLVVGVDPHLPALIEQLAADVGVVLPGGRSQQSHVELLSILLARRRSLIVLDDVWSSDVVARFREAMGAQTTIIVTTRQVAVATDLNARTLEPALLDARRSRDLVTAWAGDVPIDDEDAAGLVERCGGLPHALALCGAMLRDGVAAASLIQALDEADLQFLARRFPDYPYPDLMAALHVSVEMLTRNDPLTAELLSDLSVFAWPGSIPRSTIEMFWGRRNLSSRVTDRALTRLDLRGLLRVDRSTGQVTIHDLQRSYLRSADAHPASLQREFLAAHRPAQGWSSLEDDGYLAAHLSLHLVAAGCTGELYALIGPEWLRRRLSETGSHRSFATDAERALSAASAGEDFDVVPAFRAAMARGAIASLAYDLNPRLLAVLVRAGRLEQALAYTSVMGTLSDRQEALAMIEHARSEVGGPGPSDAWGAQYRGRRPTQDNEGAAIAHEAWQSFDAGDRAQARELARRVAAHEALSIDPFYGPDALPDAIALLHHLEDAEGLAIAASMVGQISDNTFRRQALVPLLRALAEGGDPGVGLALLRADPYPPLRHELALDYAEWLSHLGKHDAALRVVALLVEEERWRTDNRAILDAELAVTDALAHLGAQKAAGEAAEIAFNTALGVEAETLGEHTQANGAQAEALAQVGARLLDLGRHAKGRDAVLAAFSASRFDRFFGRLDELYELLVPSLCRAGEHRLAAQLAEEFPADWLVRDTYGLIARCLVEMNDLDEARRYAMAAVVDMQGDATQKLVEVLLDLGEQQVALDLAGRQTDPFSRCLAHASAGLWLARHENRSRALQVAEHAERLLPSSEPYPLNRLVPLVRVAQCYFSVGQVTRATRLLEEAETLVESIVEPQFRSNGWDVLAEGLASVGRPVQEALLAAATTLAADPAAPFERGFQTLGGHALESGCPELVVDFIVAARAIEDPLERAATLRRVIPMVSGPLAAQTLSKLWESTDDAESLPPRARVVIKFAVAKGRHNIGQPVDAIRAWSDALNFAASTEISAVWHGLTEGAAMLGTRFGPSTLTALHKEMRDVSSWWDKGRRDEHRAPSAGGAGMAGPRRGGSPARGGRP